MSKSEQNSGLYDALAGCHVTIHKLNSRGVSVFAYRGMIRAGFANGVRLEAEWTSATRDLGYTTFETGDRFTEWFYTDRWYNIMQVQTTGGALKGWYCNITRPATITHGAVSYTDLALDLWVAPDGMSLLLDEDEFAADIAITDELRTGALAGLTVLRTQIERREAPFDRIVR